MQRPYAGFEGSGLGAMDTNTTQRLQAVHVRPAQANDSRVIAALNDIASDGVARYIWESLQGEHPGLDLIDIGAERYRREDTEYSYQNCLVAMIRDDVVGMAHGWVMPEEARSLPEDLDPVLRPYAELEAPGTFYISGLAVFPTSRNRGIGSKMLQAAEKRAQGRGAGEMSLICFAENTGARRLYERHGYKVVDRRAIVPHRHIRVTGDALLMVQRG